MTRLAYKTHSQNSFLGLQSCNMQSRLHAVLQHAVQSCNMQSRAENKDFRLMGHLCASRFPSMVYCSFMPGQIINLTGQKAIWFGICPMAACYFQLCSQGCMQSCNMRSGLHAVLQHAVRAACMQSCNMRSGAASAVRAACSSQGCMQQSGLHACSPSTCSQGCMQSFNMQSGLHAVQSLKPLGHFLSWAFMLALGNGGISQQCYSATGFESRFLL